MARIHRTIGCLSQLLDELREADVTFLNSMQDILSFNSGFADRLSTIKAQTREELVSDMASLKSRIGDRSREYESRIASRREELTGERNEIPGLISRYQSKTNSMFLNLLNTYRRYRLERRKARLSESFENELRKPLRSLEQTVSSMRNYLRDMETSFERILEQRVQTKARGLVNAKGILDNNKGFLLGAIGEQQALNELGTLPDSYIIINDFRYAFQRALHRKATDEWIRTIQADHILIGPPGLYVIETKNWSDKSIQSLDLRSPVEQIHRTNYAIFRLLNRFIEKSSSPFNHHWGARQIEVNNIILMVRNKPSGQFQHAKVLTLDTICSYIRSQPKVFDADQAQWVSDALLHCCEGEHTRHPSLNVGDGQEPSHRDWDFVRLEGKPATESLHQKHRGVRRQTS